jgi:ABC-2 type transport system ATP-binding protein
MISASGLSRFFGETPAVEDLSFELPQGRLFALLGPNGAGKTTTVRLLLGLIGPNSGTATIAGLRLGQDAQTDNRIRSLCGLLTETPGFYDRMSAWENLRFFARLYRIPASDCDGRLERFLRKMDLWSRRDDLVATFSKGMKQKLAIIRTIFHDPKVIFMDEPTAGLDPEASHMVREMIASLKSEGRTIVLCTHNLGEAQRLADIVGILKRRLLVFDTLANLQSGTGGALVEVTLSEPFDRMSDVTAGLGFVKGVSPRERTVDFAVENPTRDVPRLIAALAGAGAKIYSVLPKVSDLESIYLRSVGEKEREP